MTLLIIAALCAVAEPNAVDQFQMTSTQLVDYSSDTAKPSLRIVRGARYADSKLAYVLVENNSEKPFDLGQLRFGSDDGLQTVHGQVMRVRGSEILTQYDEALILISPTIDPDDPLRSKFKNVLKLNSNAEPVEVRMLDTLILGDSSHRIVASIGRELLGTTGTCCSGGDDCPKTPGFCIEQASCEDCFSMDGGCCWSSEDPAKACISFNCNFVTCEAKQLSGCP